MHSMLRFAIALLMFAPVAAWAQTVPPAVQTALPPQPPATSEFSVDEIIDTGHHFFGAVSHGLASVVEKAVSLWGQPNGYILGEEAVAPLSAACVTGMARSTRKMRGTSGYTGKALRSALTTVATARAP